MKTLNRTAVSAAIASLAITGDADAQTGQWGPLAAGPHRVGYRTITVVDSSRRYYDGPRTIQVYVWYPATVGSSARPMAYGGYFDDAEREWGSAPDRVAYLRRWAREGFLSGALNPSFPGTISTARFDSLLRVPTRVYRGAAAARGPFPVLLHAHSSGVLHQSLTMEYLASHGYVVLSVSTYNSAPAYYGRGEESPSGLFNLAEDFGLMYNTARRMPNADVRRAAAVGMLAPGGIAFHMKSAALRAVACHECLSDNEQLQPMPYYDSVAVRVPMLELISTQFADQANPQKSWLDRFVAAERYVGRFTTLEHPDFYPFPKIANPGTPLPRYEAVLLTTLNFLNAVLRDDSAGRRFLANPTLPGLPPDFLRIHSLGPDAVPTEAEVLGWVRLGEVGRAREAVARFGPAIVTRNQLFVTVLFLARDLAPHAGDAVALFRATFPARAGTDDVRQDDMLTRLLSRRPPDRR